MTDLAARARRFSLRRLALCFSPAAIVGEFNPVSPWEGGPPPARRTSGPCGDLLSHPGEITAAFRKGIEECVGSAEAIAVSCSGGLDSTAVLYHTSEICGRERRLLAITADLRSDHGESCAALVRELIPALGIRCRWRVVNASPEVAPRPLWHRPGPRLDAMPGLNRSVAEVAEEEGADLILTGTGADELLGTPRYTLGHMLRTGHPGVCRYTRDLAADGIGRLALELAGNATTLLRPRLASQLYWAANWPELCRPDAPSVLTEAHRAAVTEWTRAWVREAVTSHREHRDGWAGADARDALFPYEPLAAATMLPKRTPFIDSGFFDWALRLPMPSRYDGREATPYQRRKALVLRLLPRAKAMLPRQKATFATAFERYQRETFTGATSLIHHRLVRTPLDADQLDATMLHRLQAVDDWVAGAEDSGAEAIDW